MDDELKPCPFCGSVDLESGGDDKVVGFYCRNCQSQGPDHYGRYEWNTRSTPKVKPLVWVDLHGDGSLYQTDVDNPLGYHAVINRRGQLGWCHRDSFFDTLEAAKAAAQADYERRILDALD